MAVGFVVDARCHDCGYAREDLRFGATHEEIGQHDVCTRELYRAPCCGEVQSVLIYMGQPLPERACEGCEATLDLGLELRYRVATLKGEVWSGHPCPRCAEAALEFRPRDKFV